MKDEMAKMLTEWLFRDFGILIEQPTEKEIIENLEEHEDAL